MIDAARISSFVLLMVTSAVSLLKNFIIAAFCDPYEFVIWPFCFLIAILFATIGTLGLSYLGTRTMSLHLAAGEVKDAIDWQKTILKAQVILLVPGILIVVSFLKYLNQLQFLQITLIALFATSSVFFQISLYKEQLNRVWFYSRLMCLKALVTLIVSTLLISQLSLTWVILWESAVLALLAFWFLRPMVSRMAMGGKRLTKDYLRSSMKYFVSNSAAFISGQGERIGSARAMSMDDFGLLSLGLYISSIAQQAHHAFNVLLVPILSSRKVENRLSSTVSGLSIFFVGLSGLSLLVAFIGQPIFNWTLERYLHQYLPVAELYWAIVGISIVRLSDHSLTLCIQFKYDNLYLFTALASALISFGVYLQFIVTDKVIVLADIGRLFLIHACLQVVLMIVTMLIAFHLAKRQESVLSA